MKKISLFVLVLLITFLTISCSNNTDDAQRFDIEYYDTTEVSLLGSIELELDKSFLSLSTGRSHIIAKMDNDKYYAWGSNNYGQLGDGTTETKTQPVEITESFDLIEGEQIINYSLGDSHSAALTNEGRVLTWGNNLSGRLGDGTTTSTAIPIDITQNFNLHLNEEIKYITTGYLSGAAITSEYRVFTWGDNSSGQLGDGTITNRYNPTDITSMFNLSINERVTYISIGNVHSAAITNEGRLFTWGNNAYGQLGDGTNNLRVKPYDITENLNLNLDEEILGLDLGKNNNILFTSENRVFVWGLNNYGQLGNGTVTNKSTPVDITNQFSFQQEESIIKVTSGYSHLFLITSNNRIFSWGDNQYGQLGNGSSINQLNPIEITDEFGLSDEESIFSISLGDGLSAMVTSEGKVFTWGNNDKHQLGDGGILIKSSPMNIIEREIHKGFLKKETILANSTL
ncbi:MAG: hypothetical protein RBR50_10435, partial [Candidatus Izemoplasmatales bacterium]|nr:hypothetical protein [Candidatus Izemoplasmatales bacterium]